MYLCRVSLHHPLLLHALNGNADGANSHTMDPRTWPNRGHKKRCGSAAEGAASSTATSHVRVLTVASEVLNFKVLLWRTFMCGPMAGTQHVHVRTAHSIPS